MDLVLTLNDRYERTPDGKVWTRYSWDYLQLSRYLCVFDNVKAVARIVDVARESDDVQRADGVGVSFVAMPYFIGPLGFARKLLQVQRALNLAVQDGDAVILRLPAWHISAVIARQLRRKNYPYAVEVCGDPYDHLNYQKSVPGLSSTLRWWFPYLTRKVCARAEAALYVTHGALQQRYPPSQKAFVQHGCSNVDLRHDAFSDAPRKYSAPLRQPRLAFVGNLQRLYKAPHILIDAVALLRNRGISVELNMIGDGALRPALVERASLQHVDDRINFLGRVPAGDSIRQHLDCVDLFVLPSFQEGLPRAMIEAMARSLPCIGSDVGGIPELLSTEDIVPAGNADALAEKIIEVVRDPARLTSMAARNWNKAWQYHGDLLKKNRMDFYQAVSHRTRQRIGKLQSSAAIENRTDALAREIGDQQSLA